MAVLVEQAADDLAAGVIGIGDEQHRLRQLQGRQEQQQFVEEGPAVAVGRHEPFVNPRREGDCLKTFSGFDQQRERLAGVAHDVFGFGVGVRSLMEGFDRRHLPARLGFFQAVGEQHEATAHSLHAGMDLEDNPDPGPRQSIDADGGAVKEIEQAAVAGRLESEGAHEAGDPT